MVPTMKIRMRLAALIMMVASMAFAAISPAAAQTPPADPQETLNALGSGVTIYGRHYQGEQGALPEPGTDMPMMAFVQVYEFPDAAAATDAFPLIEQLMKDEVESGMGAELVTEEVADLGDMATMSTVEVMPGLGITASAAALMVQQGEVIYVSFGMSASDLSGGGARGETPPPANGLANDLMTFMLEGEPGDASTVEFMADGTSTGAFFDVFPTAEDADLLQGLQVMQDAHESTD